MHMKGNGDMSGLAKGCMLRRVMSFAKVVDIVAKKMLDHTTRA